MVHDPVVSREEAVREYGIELTAWDDLPVADALVFAVAHKELVSRPTDDFIAKVAQGGCLIDVKSRLDAEKIKIREFGALALVDYSPSQKRAYPLPQG